MVKWRQRHKRDVAKNGSVAPAIDKKTLRTARQHAAMEKATADLKRKRSSTIKAIQALMPFTRNDLLHFVVRALMKRSVFADDPETLLLSSAANDVTLGDVPRLWHLVDQLKGPLNAPMWVFPDAISSILKVISTFRELFRSDAVKRLFVGVGHQLTGTGYYAHYALGGAVDWTPGFLREVAECLPAGCATTPLFDAMRHHGFDADQLLRFLDEMLPRPEDDESAMCLFHRLVVGKVNDERYRPIFRWFLETPEGVAAIPLPDEKSGLQAIFEHLRHCFHGCISLEDLIGCLMRKHRTDEESLLWLFNSARISSKWRTFEMLAGPEVGCRLELPAWGVALLESCDARIVREACKYPSPVFGDDASRAWLDKYRGSRFYAQIVQIVDDSVPVKPAKR